METDLKILALAVLFAVGFCSNAKSSIIHVPADSVTIQGGISGAVAGDTVLVAHGTYPERINFYGKAIALIGDTLDTGATIIDGSPTSARGSPSDTGSVVCFVNEEGSTTIMEGFTITGGTGTQSDSLGLAGGGIYCYASSPTIRKCNITSNSATYGAGISAIGWSSHPMFVDCNINGNIAGNGGGGIASCCEAYPEFIQCSISNNSSAFWCDSPLKITNSAIEKNAGGSYCEIDGEAVISNSTLRKESISGEHCEVTVTD